MAQSAGYSPSFKRPIVLMRKRSRSATQGPSSLSDEPGESSEPPPGLRPFPPGTRGRSAGGVRRRNPFAHTDSPDRLRKKARVAADGDMGSEPSWGSDDTGHQVSSQEPLPPPDALFDDTVPALKNPLIVAPPPLPEYPADWSLKTRLLFTSALCLSWAQQPRAHEEAQGLNQHCRAQFAKLPHILQDPSSCSELRCSFQQALVYWQHPSLPWLSLFPRINAERRFSGQNTPWAHDAALQQSLMGEWVLSLSSLYSLLKSRLCPYFYLCSSQFTVLFRTAGLGGYSNITAYISPTTRGLREALKAEGIRFSVPLMEEKQSVEQHREEEDSDPKRTTDGLACDEKASENEEDCNLSWLVEMGIQDKIRKPDGIRIQLHKDSQAVSLDHKPESLVCVEGAHTFTLINFLINCKSIVAAAGSQAGLPPTLLAPSAFRGATMHTLKSRCVNVKSQVGSSFQNISSLEITGPVLPSALHSITTLLRSAQGGNFSAALFSHSPTAVMNVHNPKLQVSEGSVDLSACGLHPASLQQLKLPSTLGKTALTHIDMDHYSYTCRN
ncbi:protein downstream neighbor of son homolog isoform X2 [Gouania willdenowi]|uniref:protein downstream neighbor of son homolog isoform X2 n=1 Tax=Gouania willdenowi TaxID=441366 RepID=UPI001056225D|nr:protein downstream neighbor of Son isoform X2 [Gouania willdenowi]